MKNKKKKKRYLTLIRGNLWDYKMLLVLLVWLMAEESSASQVLNDIWDDWRIQFSDRSDAISSYHPSSTAVKF